MSELLPYHNQGETIGVRLDFLDTAKSDVGLFESFIDRTQLTGPFPVQVEAQLPSSIDEAFPDAERENVPLSVVATIRSISGRIRTHIPLVKSKKNLFAGRLTLDPAAIPESASIRVYAARAVTEKKKVPGYAKQKGSRLAWSPAHVVRLIEKPPPKGNYLKIVWEHFDASTVVPPGYNDAFYYVHTEAEEPILYLNKTAKTPLVKLIEIKGYGHPKALPRDIVFNSIAVGVWTSLVQATFADLHQEQSFPVNFGEAYEGTWKGDVLKWIAPLVVPDVLPADAVFELCNKMGEKEYYTDVQNKVQLAIQTEHDLLRYYEQLAEGVFAHG